MAHDKSHVPQLGRTGGTGPAWPTQTSSVGMLHHADKNADDAEFGQCQGWGRKSAVYFLSWRLWEQLQRSLQHNETFC
jgi:hypothetical protein